MPPLTRRHFIAAALSVPAIGRVRSALATEPALPAGTRELWRPDDPGQAISDFRVFADNSIAVITVNYRVLPLRFTLHYFDGNGAEKWRAYVDEYGEQEMYGRLAAAGGDGSSGLYLASGFKTVLRFTGTGATLWTANLFGSLGQTIQLAFEEHPAGGVVLGGIARPVDGYCHDGVVLRLNTDGEILWQWRSNQIGYFFPTGLATTAGGVTVAHLMDYDPTHFGSDGDLCNPGQRLPWTLWLDPDGKVSRAYEWPADREAEALALDAQGRLVFFGLAKPGARSFFRIVDAVTAETLDELLLSDDNPAFRWRYRPVALRQPLQVSRRGVSLVTTDCGPIRCDPPSINVIALSEDGLVSAQRIEGLEGPTFLHPDGRRLIVSCDGGLYEVPIGSS